MVLLSDSGVGTIMKTNTSLTEHQQGNSTSNGLLDG